MTEYKKGDRVLVKARLIAPEPDSEGDLVGVTLSSPNFTVYIKPKDIFGPIPTPDVKSGEVWVNSTGRVARLSQNLHALKSDQPWRSVDGLAAPIHGFIPDRLLVTAEGRLAE